MLRMCVYEAVKSEHRAVPGFQNIIFLCGDSFIQANPVISVPESFVHQLKLLHLVFVPFFHFLNNLKQDCLILKNREINDRPFSSLQNKILVLKTAFMSLSNISWINSILFG